MAAGGSVSPSSAILVALVRQLIAHLHCSQPVVSGSLRGGLGGYAERQTGTGKTHTIWGQEQPAELRGVNFRTLEALFADAGARAKETQYSFYVSMLEVYNDQLRDLVRLILYPPSQGMLSAHLVTACLSSAIVVR
jgi:hypothetical protein